MELEQIIDVEHRFPRHSNRKSEYLRRTHGVSARRYYYELGRALDNGSMERVEPVLAHHLMGLRERRAEAQEERRRLRAA
ncbi:DUF3263 domain-containing protein [Pseudoclavibacter alba]|uniref:DUF3263 domain-containing protein n=1 Tax=Pseudoclavibacter albus TaxID=272241 RepID=UPI0019D05251|nr:DUF3263 domain-containing protein [Pseudoclavibacter alba]